MMICFRKYIALSSRLSCGRASFSRVGTVCRSSVSACNQRRRLLSLIKTQGENYSKPNSTKSRTINEISETESDSEAGTNMKTEDTPTEKSDVREAYPEIEPFDSGFLQVSDLHQIYYEQSGKADGKPVLFL